MDNVDSTENVQSATTHGKRSIDNTDDHVSSSQKRVCADDRMPSVNNLSDESAAVDVDSKQSSPAQVDSPVTTAADSRVADENGVHAESDNDDQSAENMNVDSSPELQSDVDCLESVDKTVSCSHVSDCATTSRGEQSAVDCTLMSSAVGDTDSHALNLSKSGACASTVPSRSASSTLVIVDDSDDDGSDVPMDLSQGPKSSVPISSLMNGSTPKSRALVNGGLGVHDDDLLPEPVGTWEVKQLQEELRNEETKLVLLKKIRHSQAVHRLVSDGVSKHSSSSSSSALLPQSLSGPPPLVRGAAYSSGSSSLRSGTQQAADMPRLHAQSNNALPAGVHGAVQGPPPLVMAPRQSTVASNAVRSSNSTMQTAASHLSGSSSIHSYRPPATSLQPTSEQTTAQRQAAAKLALRRQLEKTLLQIPPPKPPPPEMNFIPNINTNAEFVMLVGLEEAVKCIIESDCSQTDGAEHTSASTVKYVFTPFECVQCQTDFTPVWKRDRPGSKSVICERCVTTNQKRALKQEHTNRLKGAFVRALQQEQEIEQSLLSGTSTPPLPQSVPNSVQHHSSSTKSLLGSSGLKPGADNSRHYQQGMSSYQSTSTQRSTTTASSVTMPNLNLPSAAAAAFNASRVMFPYPQSLVPSSSTSRSSSATMDLQRQFLLEMMPRRAPVDSQALWRT